MDSTSEQVYEHQLKRQQFMQHHALSRTHIMLLFVMTRALINMCCSGARVLTILSKGPWCKAQSSKSQTKAQMVDGIA
jgi:predicted ATP-binding protein involved in virulence